MVVLLLLAVIVASVHCVAQCAASPCQTGSELPPCPRHHTPGSGGAPCDAPKLLAETSVPAFRAVQVLPLAPGVAIVCAAPGDLQPAAADSPLAVAFTAFQPDSSLRTAVLRI